MLERGLAVCETAAITFLLPGTARTLGDAYLLAGRVTDAMLLLERAVAQGAGRVQGQALRLVSLGEAYLRAGRRDEARLRAEQAIAEAQQRNERGYEVRALRLLGEIAAHGDSPHVEQAENYYHQALALADELGMRPLVAHCHLGLGSLYRNIGRDEQAQAELATAGAMYRAMEMTFWLEQTETALAQMHKALDP
jgi:tetratricopeptide (TPR) repeat protein